MPVTVRIPTPLRAVAKGNTDVQAKGDTIEDVITDLERQFPGLRERLVDDAGELRRVLHISLNPEDIRVPDHKGTQPHDSREVALAPAIARGRPPSRSRR